MILIAKTLREISDKHEESYIGFPATGDYGRYDTFEEFYKAELVQDPIVKAWGVYQALVKWGIIEKGGDEDKQFKWPALTTAGRDAVADAKTVQEVDLLLAKHKHGFDDDDIDILRI